MNKTHIFFLVALILASPSLFAERITIARANEPTLTIVIPEKAEDGVKHAADELQIYIEKFVGVKLPIVTDGQKWDGKAAFVGPCKQLKDTDYPPAKVNIESYRIGVRDGNLILVGRKWYGTEFAVYSFLEDEAGIRWFMPGPLGEYVPEHKQGELIVDVRQRVKEPDWSPRVWSGNSFFPEWTAWNHHNKVSLTNDLPWRQFQNNIFRVFPPEKYAKSHPEYYPLINGKRWIPTKSAGSRWRPCESNPEVIKLTLDYARHWFKKNPDQNGFSVGMDDISHLCQCKDCRSHDADPDAWKRREYSDRHYWFVNTLARELAKTNPDKFIGTLIYSIARRPPVKIDKLEPNVFGYITQCEAEWWRPGLKEEDISLTKEWRRRCEHLCRYTYWGLGWVTPRYFPHYMAEALKFDKELGFHGIYVEVYTNWPHTAPMIWAASKLFWNTSLDADKLLDEFFKKMFLEVAPEMKRYYTFLEKTWTGGNPGRVGWGHRRIPTQACSMTVEQLNHCESLLNAALKKATTPIVKKRIAMIQRGLKYGSYLIRERDLSEKLMTMPVSNPASAENAIKAVTKMDNLISERRTYWKKMLTENDLAAQNFQALNNFYFRGNIPASQVEGGIATALARAIAWYAQHDHRRMRQIVASLQGNVAGTVRKLVAAWDYVARERPKNLLNNGGFEVIGENKVKAEKDWVTEGAPPGWSVWHRPPRATRFEVVDLAQTDNLQNAAHEGKYAGRIMESDSACFLQSIRVKEGESYLCQLRARRLPNDGKADISLTIRWRTPDGAWYPNSSADKAIMLPANTKDWQPLYVCLDVPRGAGYLVFMCSSSGQAENTAALFDDGAVYKIAPKVK